MRLIENKWISVPKPIAPEILKQYGFELGKDSSCTYELPMPGRPPFSSARIMIISDEAWLVVNGSVFCEAPCKDEEQLKTLWFALTGKELKKIV